MSEPQVWVLIGVFAAAIFGMIGIITTSFNRTLTVAIGGVRAEISGLRESMDAKFDAMESKFAAKFEVLDKDIQALTRRAYGADQS